MLKNYTKLAQSDKFAYQLNTRYSMYKQSVKEIYQPEHPKIPTKWIKSKSLLFNFSDQNTQNHVLSQLNNR